MYRALAFSLSPSQTAALVLSLLAALALGCASPTPTAVDGRLSYLAQTDGYWQVWTAAPDGSGPHLLTRSHYEKASVAWFPSGQKLLVSALDGRLFQVDAATGDEVQIALPLFAGGDGVVSPDGRRIAFSARPAASESSDSNEIYVMNVDGSELRRLTRMKHFQHQPKWAHDERWIYFLSGGGDQTHDIWRVSPETASVEQMTVDSVYHFDLALSSEGVLAYSANVSGNYEIWAWDPASGGRPKRLTDNPSLDGGPAWSPDGRTLVYHSLRSGVLELWSQEEDSAPLQLTNHSEGARGAVWWSH